MELTTRARYAVMAMAELASHSVVATDAGARSGRISVSSNQGVDVIPNTSAVPLSQIADRQNLSLAYLEQIFAPLRRAGLVESARGRSGGYRLARSADDISVAAIMAAVDEQTRFTRCTEQTADSRGAVVVDAANATPGCTADKPCLTHGLWRALGDVTSSFFENVSLGDIIRDNKVAQLNPAATLLPSSQTAPQPRRARANQKPRIYLDYNATAPLHPAAKAAMIDALDVVGNPSSVHAEGRAARGIIEAARERVASLVGAKPSEIVFTSGATEANSWVMAQPWSTIFMADIEHDSVLAPAAVSPAERVVLPTRDSGVVDLDAISQHYAQGATPARALLTLQAANNETGVLQPLADAAELARSLGLTFHTDAVQAVGRVALDFTGLGLDLMSVSAHKMGGPKGIGALVIRDHLDLTSFVRGGGQERRRRAGTENLAAIAGFGAAAEATKANLAAMVRIGALRDRLEQGLRDSAAQVSIIAGASERLANTVAVAVPGCTAETLVIKLDLAGIAVSAGAACSSGKVGSSHVLRAMGLSTDVAKGAIRISLGPATTSQDIAAFLAVWTKIVSQPALAA